MENIEKVDYLIGNEREKVLLTLYISDSGFTIIFVKLIKYPKSYFWIKTMLIKIQTHFLFLSE